MVNALTIDLEDWFQVSNVEHIIPFDRWGECEPRLVGSTRRLLELLAAAEVRATFFVLGWNAEHFPCLVREIKDAGHEIGSHGYAHRLVYEQDPGQLASDLARATEIIGEASGVRPRCYRAPSFSITPRSTWAFDVLEGAGIAVDSSVFPVLHERYGFPRAPRLPYRVQVNGAAGVVEVPPSTIRIGGRNFPFAGGAYFRLLPQAAVERFCRMLNRRGEPVIFYLHPWELDPDIPRFRLSPFRRLRSYVNLHQTESRVARLLRAFRFGTLSEMLTQCPVSREWRPATAPSALAAERSLTGAGLMPPSGERWHQPKAAR
ncbi:MAG: XrtA system polysaccharide deacetylase [Planctomycetota bacterium]|jgi:polysaccharide deacetylase family protein (PEP-CTERM system associated)